MTAVFADTSFYVALTNPRDALHARAQELAQGHADAVVTTEYVLLETANFLSRSPDRTVFVALLGALDADPQTTVVTGSHERFVAAGCLGSSQDGVANSSTRAQRGWGRSAAKPPAERCRRSQRRATPAGGRLRITRSDGFTSFVAV